jgi:hypothetical protein
MEDNETLGLRTNMPEVSVQTLDYHGNPLPSADASRCQSVLLLSTPQFVQERDHQPRPGRA